MSGGPLIPLYQSLDAQGAVDPLHEQRSGRPVEPASPADGKSVPGLEDEDDLIPRSDTAGDAVCAGASCENSGGQLAVPSVAGRVWRPVISAGWVSCMMSSSNATQSPCFARLTVG